jgi:hypothetical protein
MQLSRAMAFTGIMLFMLPTMGVTQDATSLGQLQRDMIGIAMSPRTLQSIPGAGERAAELSRAAEIASRALDLQPTLTDADMLENQMERAVGRYGVALRGASFTNLVTEPDPERRYKMIQAATSGTRTPEELREIDDDLFWSSIGDPDEEAAIVALLLGDGSGVEVEFDPETRKGLINIFDKGDESGIPLDLVVPTSWERVETSADSNTGGNTSSQAARQSQGLPVPILDPETAPVVMGAADFAVTVSLILGFWDVNDERWHITTGSMTDDPVLAGDILDSVEDMNTRLDQLAAREDELKAQGETIHAWQNIGTQAVVEQTRYRRLDTEIYEYLGQRPNIEIANALGNIASERDILLRRLQNPVEDQTLDPSGAAAVAARGDQLRITVPVGAQCPYVFESAFFDGRTLTANFVHNQTCTMNPDLPPTIKSKLISENHPRDGVNILRVSTNPWRETIVLKGRTWGRRVHHDTDGSTINRITEMEDESALRGERILEAVLTLRSQGATDDTRL